MTLSAQTTWTNDPMHTRIGFEILHGGISWVSGRFADFDVTVTVPGDKVEEANVEARIKTASIDTGVEPRDKHLRSADFFEVESYPEMVFVADKLTRTSDSNGTMEGKLTMHGKTVPVTLDVTLVGTSKDEEKGKELAGFRLTGTVKRSDFGIGPKFLPAAIGNEVRVIIDGEFSTDAK